MEGVDAGMGDEIRTMEVINGAHLQSKDNEYSLQRPNNSDMLELNEMVIPSECKDKENSPDFFTDTQDAINLDRVGASENTCASPHFMNDAAEVEELTFRNYSSENLSVVGTSRNKDKMQTRQRKWQHLYQIPGGSGNGGSLADVVACRVSREEISSVWDDVRCTNIPEALDQNHENNYCNEFAQNLLNNTSKPANPLFHPDGIRTKILSKSGFSEYFVKSTLKGKGVICRRPKPEGLEVEFRDQTYPMVAGVNKADPGVLLSSNKEFVAPPSHLIPKALPGFGPDSFHDGVSLREWLKSGKNKVNKIKNLLIFKQIVDMVNNSHSRGVALLDLRPSYFKLLLSNEITYLGLTVQIKIIEKLKDQDVHHPENEQTENRPLEQGSPPFASQCAKKRKAGGVMNLVRRWPQFPNRSGAHYPRNKFNEGRKPELENNPWSNSSGLHLSDSSKTLSSCTSDSSELKWYSSPEELGDKCCTLSSNIYCLGILLFELLCSFDSDKGHTAAMHDLRYRILPPSFLSESPKEAGLCLWLLHPEPSSRPTTRDILQSDLINGIQDLFGNDLSSSITHEDTESELLLHFLDYLKEQKLKNSSKLLEEIRFLEADIDEVERRQMKKSFLLPCSPKESINGKELISSHCNNSGLEINHNVSTPLCNESMLMRNISQLESAYFSERVNVQHLESGLTSRDGKILLENRENWTRTYKDGEINKPADCLGTFFKGLCKYARYTKFKVRGILRNGDFNTNANVICSLSFDRDEDYFASAGVSKKIKIYDFHSLFNYSVDIHYPVLELSNKSKLSCTCWNSYIRNYLASTDYDGVVKLWDAGTGQEISQYIEHSRRAWSVDFSRVDPTKLASGSDDCSVKLWNIYEKNSLCTIRNIANVCCVQFSAKSSHLIAFGSADYKTYCYDLRNVSMPWCVLAGHEKAVSYVKFLDSETLISASTDNTLKLWDLNKTINSDLSTSACTLTLRGHTNEKHFVGLSVADDGYIACGSETNEVFAYYRSLPMPITSHKFGSIDPISGKETDDDGGQFVSSVCWRQKSDMIVAANSSGSIKLLQMV